MQPEQLDPDFPCPTTVLAIRGAIALGLQGGPRPAGGSWLAEFWKVGNAARSAAEAIHEAAPGFQQLVGDDTAQLQDHLNALTRAAGAIDALYPARLKHPPILGDNDT
ncbi:hypothetical protein CupriaWKF_31590 [Cupriavidus sp. WKF15]|uniref:hypothetical protein n=1 Tax=Cupriavidus sp. WKF15 TaxID=3032282 RepID=UPI0023E33EF7|nr:hypothetical protein [Cupriavidus sp. WKF15]WER50878.1 hypothetical protein CupriaWKF_31590 [Cupriavidus sp. WKF15]